uniref:Uncharacterized protein n=1 Tax=Leersia perrieri TaxID=77586 RepID=A0A0D9WZI5_9ORYZ
MPYMYRACNGWMRRPLQDGSYWNPLLSPAASLDTISLTALSCRKSPPSRCCCDALLYAINEQPDNVPDRGMCSLCVYIVTISP